MATPKTSRVRVAKSSGKLVVVIEPDSRLAKSLRWATELARDKAMAGGRGKGRAMRVFQELDDILSCVDAAILSTDAMEI